MRTPGEWWTMPDPSDGSFTFCVKGSGTPFAKIEFIGMRFKEEAGNAEFICKAVNSHELLVKALEKAKEQLWHPAAGQWGEDAYRCNPSVCPACIVEAALEKVKGDKENLVDMPVV